MITKEQIMDSCKAARVLAQGADYIYLLPHPALRRWISNYTITFPCAGMMSNQYTIMPHGSATLVFSCTERNISGTLFGSITKPAIVGQSANSCAMIFIVEFQPAGYYAFSKVPQKELANLVYPFEAINSQLNTLITHHLERARNIESFITEVDRLFFAHIKMDFYQQEFLSANQMILDSGGQALVKDISQNIYYSERHLNRLFDQQMGCSVKAFSRLVRINHALHLLQRPSLSMLQVCLQTGFYDVPHFIHDFKATCGITPLEYRDRMSDFYSEIAKF